MCSSGGSAKAAHVTAHGAMAAVCLIGPATLHHVRILHIKRIVTKLNDTDLITNFILVLGQWQDLFLTGHEPD